MPDGRAAVQPRRAFQSLAQQPPQQGAWLALRRPLFVAFVLACGVTMMATEPFDPRLVISNMLGWVFVPLCEALALVAVAWPTRKRIPLSRSVDLYFTGHAPWLLWFTALSFDWSLQPPHFAPSFMFYRFRPLVAGTLLVIAWSCYVDYCCLHLALGRTPLRALRDLALQRATSWTLILFIFGWGSPFAGLVDRLLPK
jgi:hypothetical protein